ncbi:hypothetical protein KY290_031135 [Solanum tuberosum]|uniref:Uncharacterized protein n=1 Tax=Solanum tuberosum TaxID=4113 RepID=A0ABQ7U8A3_SOLTU|nr:hypothetical protein KY290_031135 [Solanum tuberosum]
MASYKHNISSWDTRETQSAFKSAKNINNSYKIKLAMARSYCNTSKTAKKTKMHQQIIKKRNDIHPARSRNQMYGILL